MKFGASSLMRRDIWSHLLIPPSTRDARSRSSGVRCIVSQLLVFELNASPRDSGKVVAFEFHHLVPRRHEALHNQILRVVPCVDFRDCPELRVGTENEIGHGARPLELVGGPIAPL